VYRLIVSLLPDIKFLRSVFRVLSSAESKLMKIKFFNYKHPIKFGCSKSQKA
jgi:hypothetical protein